ncbi:MAG: hypothetical protein ACOC1X_03810 [Promethearchaeota archaeon]
MSENIIIRKEGKNKFVIENGNKSIFLENVELSEVLDSFMSTTTEAINDLKFDEGTQQENNQSSDEEKVEEHQDKSAVRGSSDIDFDELKNKIPKKSEIKEFIKKRDRYTHSTTELFEEFVNVTPEDYMELRSNDKYRKAYSNLDNKLRKIRSEIEEEEGGKFKKDQRYHKGKTRHIYIFVKNSELQSELDNNNENNN